MTKWTIVSYGARENPGCFDNGNGAIAYITENADYPGIERVSTVPYAKGRHGGIYYRLAEDGVGAFVKSGCRGYKTLNEALASQRAQGDYWEAGR